MYCIIGRAAARFNSVRFASAGLLFLAFQTCIAQSIESLESHLWTGVADIKVSGDYAFCSYRYGLVVLDVSDAAHMRQVAQLPCPGEGEGMTLRNDIVFLCMGSAGVSFIDVSSPESPVLVGQWDSPGYAFDVDVEGDFAYIGDWWHGLQIINIANLSNPNWVGGYPNQSFGWEVDVQDSVVVLADYYEGALLIDVSDPSSPELLAHLDDTEEYNDVCIRDTLLYVCSSYDGLMIYDIANPSEPELIGISQQVDATSCSIEGDLAYLCSYNGVMDIADISDPYEPRRVSRWFQDGSQSTILGQDFHDGILYIAFGNSAEFVYTYPNSGVFAVDVSDTTNPTRVGFFDSRGRNKEIVTNGNQVFVMKEKPYVSAFEWIVSGLVPMSTIDGTFIINDLKYNNGKLFIAHFLGGITIYDVSNIETPQLIIDQLGLTGLYPTISVDDSFAYVYTSSNLKVFDIRELPNLYEMSETSIRMVGDREIFSNNGILYLASLNGLQIYDATNVLEIDSVSNIPIPCTDLEVVGTDVWVTASDSSLYLFDIFNSLQFQEVLHLPTRFSPTCLTVQGELIWVGEGFGGVEVFRFNPPDEVEAVAYWDSPGNAQGIATLDSLIVLADTYGIHVLDLDESSNIREVQGPVSDFYVFQNYPNPFNSATRINFMLEQSGRTELRIYDTLGREVATLLDEVRQAGPQSVTWEATGVPSGVYFARLMQGEQSRTLKMVLLK